jgi:hypothetical protein
VSDTVWLIIGLLAIPVGATVLVLLERAEVRKWRRWQEKQLQRQEVRDAVNRWGKKGGNS